jgi:hypothetical protein
MLHRRVSRGSAGPATEFDPPRPVSRADNLPDVRSRLSNVSSAIEALGEHSGN